MDFSLTEEQNLLRNSARDFLTTECPKSVVRELEASETGHSPELWRKMADLGWMGLPIPEEYGGAGFSLLDLAVLFEEFGRAAMPGPMFSTIVLGSLPILDFGTQEQKREYLPGIASGELIFTMALSEPAVQYDPRFVTAKATPADGGFTISGSKLFVPYAHLANYLLVMTRTSGAPGDTAGITVFIVDGRANGLTLTPFKTIAADKQFEVTFDEVFVPSDQILGHKGEAAAVIGPALMKARAIQCAEMVGGAQADLEITAEYTKTRHQFQRPIGTFQAVQHRLADMYIDVSGARWTAYQAIWRISEGLPAEREVAIAKSFVDTACQRVALSAQQLHGGIGFDRDYDIHFYYRRTKAFELKLGTTEYNLGALERALGL